MININEVSYSYHRSGEKQINEISIEVSKGEIILLCGKSGSGKTTITKLVNGLIPHFLEGNLSGTTYINGKDTSQMKIYEISEQVGSVFQNPKTQFFNLDSNSELAFGLENKGEDPSEIKKKVSKAVSDLGIEQLVNRNVFKMSGGEKQLLAIASIYATSPQIYVFDEPSANIDECGIKKIREALIKLKTQGKTIIISEHRLYYLMDLLDRVIYLQDGEIKYIFEGSEFTSLSDELRRKMGLRTFVEIENDDFVSPVEYSDMDDFTVSNLKYSYSKQNILKNINISANKGDIIAVTGENGQGKTTLMKILCGLLKEKEGLVKYKGKPFKHKSRRKLCYMVMQDVIHQLFSESVIEEFALSDSKITKEEAEEILIKLELINYKNTHPLCLSGGQMQRLAVAVGILMSREIIILDEPTSGLDYLNMLKISEVINKFSKDKIIFVVTHDKELIDNVCNKLLKISDGKVSEFYERR